MACSRSYVVRLLRNQVNSSAAAMICPPPYRARAVKPIRQYFFDLKKFTPNIYFATISYGGTSKLPYRKMSPLPLLKCSSCSP